MSVPTQDVTASVRQALDILRYDEQKAFKLSFELIGLLAKNADYAEEFIEQGGLGVLMSLLKMSRGAFQGYILGAVRSLLLYISAIDEVADHPEIVERLYTLLAPVSSPDTNAAVAAKNKLAVQKQVLEILIVLCGMLEDGHSLIHKVAKARHGSTAPYGFIATLLLSPDLLVVRNALTFLNILMTKRKEIGEKKLKKLVFLLENGGVLASVKQLVVVEDEMVKKQVTVFQKLSNVSIPLSFYEAVQWKNKFETLKKQFDQVNEQLFFLRQQQPKYCLMKRELSRSREALEAMAVLFKTTPMPHPSGRANAAEVQDSYKSAGLHTVDLSDVREDATTQKIRRCIFQRLLESSPELGCLIKKELGPGEQVDTSGNKAIKAPRTSLLAIDEQDSDSDTNAPPSESDEDLPPMSDDEELPPPSDDEDAPPGSDDEDAPPAFSNNEKRNPSSSGATRRRDPSHQPGSSHHDPSTMAPPTNDSGVPADPSQPSAGGVNTSTASSMESIKHPSGTSPSQAPAPTSATADADSSPTTFPANTGASSLPPPPPLPTPPPPPPVPPPLPSSSSPLTPLGTPAGIPPPVASSPGAFLPPPPSMRAPLAPGTVPSWTAPSGTATAAAFVSYWKGPAPKKKMRVFHWEKIKMIPDVARTFWNQIHTGEISCEYNYEEFESMFSQKEATNKKERVVVTKVQLIDPKKYQNISIMLYKLPTIPQIQSGVLDLDDDLITRESLEAMIAQAPSVAEIKDFAAQRDKKPIEEYDPPEQFFAMAISTTEFERRCSTWLFIRDWSDNIENAKKPIHRVGSAVHDVRCSKSLPYIMGLILGFGNMMNYENKLKGNAPAFKYTTLSKLDALKDKSGKVSLLNYLITTIQSCNPAALEFPDEVKSCLNNVTSVKTEDMEKAVREASEQLAQFHAQVHLVQKVLEKEGGDDVGSSKVYTEKMEDFHRRATLQVQQLQAAYEAVLAEFQEVLIWWSCSADVVATTKTEDFFAEFVPFVMRFKALSQDIVAQNRKRQVKRGKKLEANMGGNDGSTSRTETEDVLGAIVNQLQEKLVSG